jgi:hypothetical protein
MHQTLDSNVLLMLMLMVMAMAMVTVRSESFGIPYVRASVPLLSNPSSREIQLDVGELGLGLGKDSFCKF